METEKRDRMTEKRYYEKRYGDEFYIFDSNTISESDFEEKLEYQDYKAFEDSMMGDEVVNRLNELNNENEQSKMMIATLRNIVLENEDLEKENQYIKNTIQTMLNNERTHIGQSVLKQLWEVIQ